MVQGQNKRRIKAQERLEAQLKAGTKPEKVNGKTTLKLVELTESDIKRISQQLATLKSRI